MPVAVPANLPPDRVTVDLIERTLYSRDLAPVPAMMVRPFFQTLPEAVVRPADAGQVAEVVRQATRAHVPITPRAAATTSFYDAVPVRGGLVLDLNDLRGGIELDAPRQTVRVLPATTWYELDEALQRTGFAVKSYPSSALSATVGGWISTQGHGIGSLKYGAMADQLVALQVVLPGGETRAVDRQTDPPLEWFVAAEGTLGVITAVELEVRPRPEVESLHMLSFNDPLSLGSALLHLSRSEARPFTMLFADPGYFRLLARSGFPPPLDLVDDQLVLLACFQGEPGDVRRGRDELVGLRGRELPTEAAVEEWGHRLYHLRVKRGGPSLLAAEQWLPLAGLAGYLSAVGRLGRSACTPIGSYGVVVSPDWALVMSLYPADERRPMEYLAGIGFTKRLHDLGSSHGGRPYGVGLWNTAYLSRVFSRQQLTELRRRKARLDPSGVMNPGKLYRAPFPLWPATFRPGAWVLAAIHVALGRRKR